jgi:hypothetical protein
MSIHSEEDSDESDDIESADKWDKLTGFFNARSPCLNVYCIDFSAATAYDRIQLKLPKNFDGQKLYTASFFCKEHDDWFIYRVMLPVSGDVPETISGEFLRSLTKKALNIYTHRARTKNPLLYFREIRLD